jgi:hypothetical protein
MIKAAGSDLAVDSKFRRGNSFRRTLYGKLEDSPEGTLISIRFRLSLFIRFFLFAWAGALGAFALFFLWGRDFFSLIPISLIAFLGWQAVQFGLSRSQEGEEQTVSCLKEMLEGSRATRKPLCNG